MKNGYFERGLVLVVFATIGFLSSVPAIAQDYDITDIGMFPGGTFSLASDINNQGQVIGYTYFDMGGGAFLYRAFLWTPEDGLVDIGTLGGERTEPQAVNDMGQVVGYSYISPGRCTYHAFLWENGDMIDLGTLGGQ